MSEVIYISTPQQIAVTVDTGGFPGLSAYQIWLNNGNTGSEQTFLDSLKGIKGDAGDSAYQTWLDQGNTGSQQDFLDDLRVDQINSDWNAVSGKAQILNKPVFATVATTGSYSDLSGKPILGTAAALDTSAFATAAQGILADSAVQPAQIASFETTTQLNDRDTVNRNRANHTGTQAISTIVGLTSALDGKQATGNYLLPSDISSFETTTQLNNRDTVNRNRANHTGTQAMSTIVGLTSALDGKQPIGNYLLPSDISSFETTTQLNNRDTANRNRANHTGTQAISTIIGLETAFAAKQDILISGTHIKTLNGIALVGSGNYALAKSDVGLSNVDNTSDATKNAAQTLLTNKLQIGTLRQILQPTGTTQTIDWNQGSIVDLLLNLATGNVTLTLLNPVTVTTYLIKVTQGISIRNLIFPTGSVQPLKGGNIATFLYPNSETLLSILWDGSKYFINFSGRNY